MKLPFSSITPLKREFKISLNSDGVDVVLDGVIYKKNINFAIIEARLSGKIELTCDLCADEFVQEVDEKINLKVTDKIYKSDENSNKDYDIIEFLDGVVDIDEVLLSEVNAIKYDYHKCNDCLNLEEGE